MVYSRIFKTVKNIIPRISDTELIALRSGTTSIDRELFKGKVELPKYKSLPTKFSQEKIDNLIKCSSNRMIYPYNTDIIDYIGNEKFFSFIIGKEYGGTPLSVSELSSVLTKITSEDPPLGVCVMVPNSLGPGELISHYGTFEQKDKYLSGLADGTYVPCFGLTGPHNGSDALGAIDKGTVIEKDGRKVIEITINKRYITLAPVANLIGLAFHLEDPNNLLDGKEGVSLALLERGHQGLKQESYHNPLNVGFPNGTLKGTFHIELEQIIGGPSEIGNGWKMLMECLAAGRGICLPATANASSKTACFGLFHYIKHRKQFNIPLMKMEGVSSKYLEIIYHTWLIQSSIGLTNQLLDNGEKPAVISAIMKQQTTERGRIVLNHAMDIHAGSSICLGKNNFLEKFYRSAPIGITVEGSNTLTRNLIIFGQGLNKSHPYISDILTAVLNNDLKAFKPLFNSIVKHSLSLYGKSLLYTLRGDSLEKQTVAFAHLSNIVALKGGAVKREQQLSGDMADILSNLYLAYSVRWYHEHHNVSKKLTDYCIQRLLNENKEIFNRVVSNLNWLSIPTFHLKTDVNNTNYNDLNDLMDEIMSNPKIIHTIKEDVYVKDNTLEELEQLSLLDENSDEYIFLYNKVIQVSEIYI